ncbi:hypothetical protein TASIC1_0001026000 [Trichoderma asperellum]|uniref:Uncharacterized protein n=1 Tax=Trichoderma asperellum TaxID=101201 RepID=A0A6V8QLL9_TRIAP|nr:hypothetical protein TASIC1_0001026000 [Trichoderma asperellum]
MATGKRPYPRAHLRKIVKAHAGMKLSKNADVLHKIYLNYSLFMNALVKEAAIHARQSGERGFTPRNIMKALPDVLARFKG